MDEALYERLYALEDGHWWFRGRRAVIGALLGEAALEPQPRILDAGCGTGRNLQDYARVGPAHGVEPSATAVAFCHARGLANVRQGTLESLPYGDGAFDLLVASDVLEHIRDHGLALDELRRVAAPGAWLVLTVPAYPWLWSAHDEAHHHYRRYTRRGLVEAVSAHGWQPTVATYFNTALLAPIAAVRLIQRLRPPAVTTDYERTPKGLNRMLAAPMQAEARLIAAGLRFPAGVSAGLVARTA